MLLDTTGSSAAVTFAANLIDDDAHFHHSDCPHTFRSFSSIANVSH